MMESGACSANLVSARKVRGYGVASRRRKAAWAVLIAGCGAALVLLAAPPVERQLLTEPTCFAFVGMKRSAEPVPWAIKVRDLAIAQGAIDRPQPPYVMITSVGADADLTNVVLAVKGAAGWQVSEASQPWDMRTQKILPFQRLQGWTLDGASQQRLEQLLAKDCLYREPRFVAADPEVHFDLGGPRRVYDPTYRTIEVHDGQRRVAVVQGYSSGVLGAISDVVLNASHGFLAPAAD